jgi:hypothetical protein
MTWWGIAGLYILHNTKVKEIVKEPV